MIAFKNVTLTARRRSFLTAQNGTPLAAMGTMSLDKSDAPKPLSCWLTASARDLSLWLHYLRSWIAGVSYGCRGITWNSKAVAKPDDVVAMSLYENKFEFLGVKTPVRRKLSKGFFQTADWLRHWLGFYKWSLGQSHRELQHAVLDYLESRKKLLTPSDLPGLKKLAQTKSWYWLSDRLGRIHHCPIRNQRDILAWSSDVRIFIARAGWSSAVAKEETDTELLEKILVNNLGQTEFFD